MGLGVSWKGWAALATFALQNGLAILLVRYSKLHDKPYSSQVAVLLQEVCVKLPFSIVMYAWESGGALQAWRNIAEDLRLRPVEWLQLSVPALLYTVQNTMLYVGFANVEAAVGQVTYQSKILWTALFSVLIMGKRLSPNHWLSLVVLALGIAAASCGQAASAPPAPPAPSGAAVGAWLDHAAVALAAVAVSLTAAVLGAEVPLIAAARAAAGCTSTSAHFCSRPRPMCPLASRTPTPTLTLTLTLTQP